MYYKEFNLHFVAENAQKLYVRLFSRKLAWLPLTKIKYSEIGEDLEPFVGELGDGGLVSCGKSSILRSTTVY